MDLLVVGSVNADIYIEVDRLPIPGELVTGNEGSGLVLPGGKGANQAVAAARLSAEGVKVSFCGSFGSDTHATMLKETMTGYGCDLTLSTSSSKPSGQAFIILQKGGENSIILCEAANGDWPSALSPAVIERISTSRGVMLQREIPDYVNCAVAACAASKGVPVFMDVGGSDKKMDRAILPHLHLLAPNETELAHVTGLPTRTEEEIIAAAKALQATGVKNVLVTIGKQGSLFLSDKGHLTRQEILRADKVVDTTGAGDCFRAAFVTRFLESGIVGESLHFAAAASSLCVGRKGAMSGMPSRAEVVKLVPAKSRL